MKKHLIMLVLCLTTVSTAVGQTREETDPDIKAVQQLVQDIFNDIWSAKKKETISKYHTKDFVLLEHGEV